MLISHSGCNENYILNHARSKRIKDGFLITTDYGSWVYLSDEEYEQLKKGDLKESSLSLLREKGVILDQNNVDNIITDYRRKYQYLFQGTSLHIVVPTLRCNLKCVYCHSIAKSLDVVDYDMDKKTAKKTVDFIFQSPSKAITIEFQGGEPLLRFDLVRYIIKYAKQLNQKYKKDIKFSLVTNLTLMNDDILDFLINETVGICTSLDGCKYVHNKNRQEYDKTVHWIKKIKKKYSINAMLLVTKYSLPYYEEIVDEYVKLGLKTIWIKPVNNLGYAKEKWKDIGITAEEFLTFWKEALYYTVNVNKKTSLRENYARIILKKILKKECVNFTDLETPCGAAIGQLAYNYNGDIYTCDEGKLFDIFKLGTVNDKYKDLLTSRETACIVRASINDNSICEICAYKPYCGLCPVCSYSETNNIITKLPNRRCDILMGMFDHIFEKLLFDKEYRKVFFSWLGEKQDF